MLITGERKTRARTAANLTSSVSVEVIELVRVVFCDEILNGGRNAWCGYANDSDTEK